ncbi:carbonic anhydrase [Diaporthe helianthi]|uniref:Carbonic anhydrase n=1 Tax=Diaporthe helianthi TaxID=158607 RepID=A0A2P5HMT9_DIAHE|nr:carbonic anhydrase [Diaporthe helianthi]
MVGHSLVVALSLATATLGCATHNYHAQLAKRQDGTRVNSSPGPDEKDWSYDASFDWGRVSADYELCQAGTQQSPIALSLNNGLSLNHIPTFNYPNETLGNFWNWGYGPAFSVQHPEGFYTENPSVTYDNETVYLLGWHIHTPADHSINNYRARAELHLVHADAEGHEKAVFAIILDAGNTEDAFVSQFPTPLIRFNDTQKAEMTLSLPVSLDAVARFNEFWSYEGSLTSPPCHEGIRWFVARKILFTSVEQMQMILAASTYSAREEQVVWQHKINE